MSGQYKHDQCPTCCGSRCADCGWYQGAHTGASSNAFVCPTRPPIRWSANASEASAPAPDPLNEVAALAAETSLDDRLRRLERRLRELEERTAPTYLPARHSIEQLRSDSQAVHDRVSHALRKHGGR